MSDQIPLHTLRRLAFARYIYTLGVLESKKRMPLCAASILMFHDAVELFLQIASEHLDAGKAQPAFLDYWDILAPKVSSPIPQKEAMRRLNKARVALKHHGTTPSSEDIVAFRETVVRFFEESSPVLFGIHFSRLTLVEFVEPESARKRLAGVLESVGKEGVTTSVLAETAIAFEEIVKLREREISPGPFAVFPFGRPFDWDPLAAQFQRGTDKALVRQLGAVTKAVAELQRISRMQVMGIDFTAWIRFQSHLPIIHTMMDGSYKSTFRASPEGLADVHDVEFCVQFAIETSLTFQQGIKPWLDRGA